MTKMLRWTEERLADFKAKGAVREHTMEGSHPKQSKYHNKKFQDDNGDWWDSLKEYKRWCDLRLLETAGKIERLDKKVTFDLLPAAIKDGKRIRPIRYIADFVYFEDGAKIVEDAKGYRNALYLLKKRMMWQLLGIDIFET